MQLLRRWTLFKISGIPIRLDLSVAFLVIYLIYIFFNIAYPILSFLVGLYVSAGLLISILLHELAHSFCVIVFGGRVRDITLQLLGGCAMIAHMPPRPLHECIIAVAGPLCSLGLAVSLWAISLNFTHTAFWFEILAI
jgi:Zn-dependent protease